MRSFRASRAAHVTPETELISLGCALDFKKSPGWSE